MCMEDLLMGMAMPDETTSTKQVFAGTEFSEFRPLVIPPNPERFALRVWGWVFLLGNQPELPTNRSQGWIEVWRDNPDSTNAPFTNNGQFDKVVCLLTQAEHTQLFLKTTEGLLIERQFTLRPANLDTFVATDAIVYLGFTQYVLKEDYFRKLKALKGK